MIGCPTTLLRLPHPIRTVQPPQVAPRSPRPDPVPCSDQCCHRRPRLPSPAATSVSRPASGACPASPMLTCQGARPAPRGKKNALHRCRAKCIPRVASGRLYAHLVRTPRSIPSQCPVPANQPCRTCSDRTQSVLRCPVLRQGFQRIKIQTGDSGVSQLPVASARLFRSLANYTHPSTLVQGFEPTHVQFPLTGTESPTGGHPAGDSVPVMPLVYCGDQLSPSSPVPLKVRSREAEYSLE
jgi:hypothetical protein